MIAQTLFLGVARQRQRLYKRLGYEMSPGVQLSVVKPVATPYDRDSILFLDNVSIVC